MKPNTGYIAVIFLLLTGCSCLLAGCPSSILSHSIPISAPSPEEKAYRLPVNQPITVPIAEDEATMYRFETHISHEGLYRFETMGRADTLCALLQKENQQEHFLLVRDVGGIGENCRIQWYFPPGTYTFKVRVDGQQNFQAILRSVAVGKSIELQAKTEKPHKERIEHRRDVHRYSFSMAFAKLVQFRVQGKGSMQCLLRRADGSWLSPALFRHQHGTCTIAQKLPPGKYTFELRTDVSQADYILWFEPMRLQELQDNQLQEGYLQAKSVDIFRFQLLAHRRHLLQTFGDLALHCTLETPLGRPITELPKAPDGRNCLLAGQFKPGPYYLRVRLRQGHGGIYHTALRQQTYTVLSAGKIQQVIPHYQETMQLYRMDVPESRLYQIEISGRTLRCSLHNLDQQPLSIMDLSEPQRCLLFANLYQGQYFLQVYPTKREELPYQVRLVAYQPPQGNQLKNHQPYLIGPVRPGFRRAFQLELQQPQLLVLETRGLLDTVCELFDSNQQRLAYNDDGGRNYNCRIHRYLQPGRYHFHVRISGRRSGIFWVQSKAKPLPWVSLGKEIPFSFTHRKQRMIYLLQVRQQGLFSIRTESKLDTKCQILSQEWKRIAEDDDSGTQRNCFLARFLSPGIYPLQIWLYRQDAGNIKLLTARLPLQDIALGQRQNNHLSSPNWTQFYKIQVKQPGIYLLRTQGFADTKCTLHSEQNQILATNDDRGGGDKNCQIVETLQTGTYFFQVFLHKGSQKPSSQGVPYQAWFDIYRSSLLSLPMQREISVKMSPETIQRFRFQIKQPGQFRIETKGMMDPRCILYDNNLLQLAKDDDSGIGRNCRIVRYFKPGDYEIHVRPATPDRSKNTGHYTIGIFPEN